MNLDVVRYFYSVALANERDARAQLDGPRLLDPIGQFDCYQTYTIRKPPTEFHTC